MDSLCAVERTNDGRVAVMIPGRLYSPFERSPDNGQWLSFVFRVPITYHSVRKSQPPRADVRN